MLKKILNWFTGNQKKQVPEKDEHITQHEFIPMKSPVNPLEYLSFVAQEALRSGKAKGIVVFDKVLNVAYNANRERLEHLYELSLREGENEFGVEAAKLVISFLTLERIGYINDKEDMLFAIMDKRYHDEYHRALCMMFSAQPVKPEDWWREFGVSQKDIRHARTSNQPLKGRMYEKPLVEWFKHVEKPKDFAEEQGEFIVVDRNNQQSSRWIHTRWYKIEINHSYIRAFIKRKDKTTLNKILKELKSLRRQLPSHHVVISMMDNTQDIPKEFEVLKEL